MPALGSADCFHDLSAATAVRAGPTVNAPAAMTVRADILARPGCSVCGVIAGIERLTGIGCMHPGPCTSAFVLRVLRVVPRHSCLLTVLNAPISRWLPLMAEIDGRKADIRHSWPHCEAAPSVRRYLEPMNFQSAAKVLVRHSRRMADDGSNGAPVARQPLEETSNEEVSCCFCRGKTLQLRSR